MLKFFVKLFNKISCEFDKYSLESMIIVASCAIHRPPVFILLVFIAGFKLTFFDGIRVLLIPLLLSLVSF